MAWKKEYSKRSEIQWGLATNSHGIGSYIRLTKDSDYLSNPRYNVRKWSGNSIGFPHTGGAHGFKTFKSKTEAIAFVEKHIRKYPSYTKSGNIVDLDGVVGE